MKFNLFFIFFGILFSITNIYALNNFDDNLEYLYFYQDNLSLTNKVSYQIIYDGDILNGDIFKFEAKYNNQTISNCENELIFEKNSIYKKVACDVEKKGEGLYTFIGKILRDNQILVNIENKEYVLGDINANTNFLELENSTIVFLNVEGVGSNLVVKSKIPKEVIKNLNSKNKNSLIESQLEYKILEEDPLIAWNVEKAPVKINYTIKKKFSDLNKDKFEVEITQKKEFAIFKAIIIVLIILIIILVLKPVFTNKSKIK